MSEEKRVPNFIRHQLNEIAQIKGFKKEKFDVECGDIISSPHVLKFVLKAIENSRELSLVIKVAPVNGSKDASLLLEREILAYNEVIPALLAIQDQHKIDKVCNFSNIARCYFSRHEPKNEKLALIMDDLDYLGYKMINKCDFSHAKLVMKALGKFHALSFALQTENPEQFAKFKELTEIVQNKSSNKSFEQFISLQFNRALAILQQEDSKIQKILTIRDNLQEFLNFCTDSAKAEPFCVLSHGEFWIDNFMFYYREDDTLEDVKILDWQLMRCTTPVLDLLYFLFTSTDKALRQDHYDNLLKIYHNSLRDYLDILGGQPEMQFPLTALYRHLKIYGKFGLIMAIFVLPNICLNEEPLCDNATKTHNKKVEESYKTRMNDVIRDVIRYGYI